MYQVEFAKFSSVTILGAKFSLGQPGMGFPKFYTKSPRKFRRDFMPERIIALFRMPRPNLGALLVTKLGRVKHVIGSCLTSNYFDYHHHLSFDLQYRMGRRPDYHIA